MVQAVLAMAESANITEIQMPRHTCSRQREEGRSPPPSYAEATSNDDSNHHDNAAENTTISLSSSGLDSTNNNTKSSDTSSVEILGNFIGARQGSHVPPANYRRINQHEAAQAYEERLRSGQFEDCPDEAQPPDHLDCSRSVLQSPLGRNLPSVAESEVPSLVESIPEAPQLLSDISSDEDNVRIVGHASSETSAANAYMDDSVAIKENPPMRDVPDDTSNINLDDDDDVLVLHEDQQERADLEADLSPESADLVRQLEEQLRQYDSDSGEPSKQKTKGINIIQTEIDKPILHLIRSRQEKVSPQPRGPRMSMETFNENGFLSTIGINYLYDSCNEYNVCKGTDFLLKDYDNVQQSWPAYLADSVKQIQETPPTIDETCLLVKPRLRRTDSHVQTSLAQYPLIHNTLPSTHPQQPILLIFFLTPIPLSSHAVKAHHATRAAKAADTPVTSRTVIVHSAFALKLCISMMMYLARK